MIPESEKNSELFPSALHFWLFYWTRFQDPCAVWWTYFRLLHLCWTGRKPSTSYEYFTSSAQVEFSDYHNYLITLSYWHFSTIGSLWMKKSSCISMFPCTLTMSQFGLDPHRPARALKVEGVPKLSIEQNGIFLTANNSKVIKYEPFLTFYLLKPTCEGDNSRGKRLRPRLFISAGHRVWHGDYYQHAATFLLLF